MSDGNEFVDRRMPDPTLLAMTERVTELTGVAQELIREAKVRQEQQERDRRLQADLDTVLRSTKRLLVAVWVKVVLMLICIIGLMILASANRDNAAAIRDCTTPSGTCAQSNAARTAAVILDVEVKRNLTEIGLARERGDVVAEQYRQEVVDSLSQDVRSLNEYAEAVRRGDKEAKPPLLHPVPPAQK